jgi:hypothetical protein
MLSLVGHGELVHSDKVSVSVYGALVDPEDDLLLVQTLWVGLDGVVYGMVVGLNGVVYGVVVGLEVV